MALQLQGQVCNTGPAFGGNKIIEYLLREAIDCELTEPQRETVLAHFYNRLSVPEIADLHGIAQQTVRRRLQQSNAKLSRALHYATRYAQLEVLTEGE